MTGLPHAGEFLQSDRCVCWLTLHLLSDFKKRVTPGFLNALDEMGRDQTEYWAIKEEEERRERLRQFFENFREEVYAHDLQLIFSQMAFFEGDDIDDAAADEAPLGPLPAFTDFVLFPSARALWEDADMPVLDKATWEASVAAIWSDIRAYNDELSQRKPTLGWDSIIAIATNSNETIDWMVSRSKSLTVLATKVDAFIFNSSTALDWSRDFLSRVSVRLECSNCGMVGRFPEITRHECSEAAETNALSHKLQYLLDVPFLVASWRILTAAGLKGSATEKELDDLGQGFCCQDCAGVKGLDWKDMVC